MSDQPLSPECEKFINSDDPLIVLQRGSLIEHFTAIEYGARAIALTGHTSVIAALNKMNAVLSETELPSDSLTMVRRQGLEAARDALQAGNLVWCGKLPLTDPRAIEDTHRGIDLLGRQILDHPFGDQQYWLAFNHGVNDMAGGVMLSVRPMAAGLLGSKGTPFERHAQLVALRYLRADDTNILSVANIVNLFFRPDGSWIVEGAEDYDPENKFDLDYVMDKNLVSHAWAFAFQMLNTEGVPAEKVTPTAKQQKPRLRSGKQPLPSHFEVDSEEYVTVLRRYGLTSHQPVSTGTHASPVMHVRRGHERTLHRGTPEQRVIWIRDMIVNARKETPFTTTRLFYDATKLN